jgi:beta-phosphoglucomutase
MINDFDNVGVLFDLDGVIVNTEPAYTRFWEDIEKVYPTGVPDFTNIIKGNTLSKILSTYFPDERKQSAIIAYLHDFEQKMPMALFPGAIEFVSSLNACGIPCCIVTSSDNRKMSQLYLQHPDFRSHFQAVVTGDMVVHSKPHPECFLRAAALISRRPADCFVFEDSPHGISAGIASGARVIALATMLSRDRLSSMADFVIDGFQNFSVDNMLSVNRVACRP